MKRYFLHRIFVLGIVIAMVAGCGNPGKRDKGVTPDGKIASVEVEVFDPVKIKDQIVEVIEKAPKSAKLVEMLNEAGASYIFDLTLPLESTEKLMTTTTKSLGQGMYGFDFKYATVYNRGDVAVQLNDIMNRLFAEVGISSDVNVLDRFGERIRKNQSNKDSLDFLATEAINEFNRQMMASDHVGVYALTVIGANIESLYVLSQMALLAKDNSKFLALLSNQQERVKSLNQLLELMSGDETVKPYYESMRPVIEFFEANATIGNEQLKQIAPEIEKVRNSMIR
jgi:hypothetical protein